MGKRIEERRIGATSHSRPLGPARREPVMISVQNEAHPESQQKLGVDSASKRQQRSVSGHRPQFRAADRSSTARTRW
jgi:hypothetical protein